MIENQSDNIDSKENEISDQDNVSENELSQEKITIESDQSSPQKIEEIK